VLKPKSQCLEMGRIKLKPTPKEPPFYKKKSKLKYDAFFKMKIFTILEMT
jgi:hypothetical protein